MDLPAPTSFSESFEEYVERARAKCSCTTRQGFRLPSEHVESCLVHAAHARWHAGNVELWTWLTSRPGYDAKKYMPTQFR